MTKLQSSLDVAVEILRDLEEFNRSGSKEAFRKQLCEEFVRRSGAASLDEALATAMTSLLCLTLGEARGRSRSALSWQETAVAFRSTWDKVCQAVAYVRKIVWVKGTYVCAGAGM
jgi:hypothetical protein